MTEIEAFCNLSEEDLKNRRRELRDELVPHARGREEMPNGLALFFDATQTMRDQLDDFVAFERECCPGLGFAVQETSGLLRLEISGIGSDASVFAGVGVAVSDAEQPASGSWRRLARSAGLGAVGAFVVFCVIPIAAVAVLGAQIAAPLGELDNPWIIGGGALVFAGLLWWWERRREGVRAASTSTPSCGC